MKGYTGSICLTDLNNEAKKGNKAFSRGKNGKIYVNVVQFFNEMADQYGNDAALIIQREKDSDEKAIYIGNFKEMKAQEPGAADLDTIPEDDDLPF